jgi:hypothetical protein
MRTIADSSSFSNPVSITVVIILLALSAGLYMLQVIGIPVLVAMIIISLLIGASLKIADQWEKAVVLRMGRFSGLKGPGLFFIVPILDQINSFISE